ncbi:MAG: hypothetical protein RL519_1373, partial [Pseudomonadota bacterium]
MDFGANQFNPGSVSRLQPCAERVPIAAPGDSAFANGHHPFTE